MLARLFPGYPISKLAFDPPRPSPNRAGLALVLIVRDEARHIGEWARFHRLAGAAHVIVYDNACSDATIPVLRAALPGRLTVVPWAQKLRAAGAGREIHNQVLAYAHAVGNFGARFRWMAPIDADEFLVPVAADSLESALAPLSDCPAITLPWHCFGRNGHRETPAGGVVTNYTRRAADPMSGISGVTNFKTIFDPARVTMLGVHRVETDGARAIWNDAGRRVSARRGRDRAFYSAGRIQLNHYYARSEAELAAKIARGSNRSVDAARHAARVRRKIANIEAAEVEDRTALDFLGRIGAGDIAAGAPDG